MPVHFDPIHFGTRGVGGFVGCHEKNQLIRESSTWVQGFQHGGKGVAEKETLVLKYSSREGAGPEAQRELCRRAPVPGDK